MKAKLLFPLLIPMMCSSLTGCNQIGSSSMKLTFGNYMTTDDANLTDAKIIDQSDLAFRMSPDSEADVFKKENFIVVVASKNGCVCWNNFKPILKRFIAETHYMVYEISTSDLKGKDSFGINYKDGYTSMAIVKQGKILKQYLGSSIFEDYNAFKSEIDKYVIAPELYYARADYVDSKIQAKQDKLLVNYVWDSCGDCKYSLPNATYPLAYSKKFKTKMYLVQLDSIKDDTETYNTFRASHYMSNAINKEFGYDRGFVPTIHYYEKGELKDATVYFNDAVEKVNGQYVVTRSFYSEERKEHLGYLNGIETPVLEGLILQDKDVDVYGDGAFYSWKHESAHKYHKPLFDAFMKKYAL